MITIAVLHAGRAAADYYLKRQAGCSLDYYRGTGERAGYWLGSGAQALGLAGELDPAGAAALRALLDGEALGGGRLVRPVLRPDPAGRLRTGPLLRAVSQAAGARGLTPVELFDQPADRNALATLLAAQTGRVRRVPAVDARLAGRLAGAAGIDPHQLYRTRRGRDRYATALARAEGKVDARVAGLDVTISPPKSVSVLYALGDPHVISQIWQAHEKAVAGALGYLERAAGHGLRGHQGGHERAAHVRTDGLIACAFGHRTSREDDPQLHTHLVIPNVLRGLDGRWSSIDTLAVHRHAKTAGYLYQAVLRGELTAGLGVDWTAIHRGVAEIRGVPDRLCRLFSTRRQEIEAELERTGGHGREAAQRACYATRPAKTQTFEPALRDRWAARTAEYGYDPRALLEAALHRTHSPDLPELDVLARQLCGPEGLTRHRTSFTRADLLQELCMTLPGGAHVDAAGVERLADRLLADPDRVVPLTTVTGHGRAYTTVDLLRTEEAALELASRARTVVPALDEEAVRAAIGWQSLSTEQRRAVRALLTSRSMVEVVVGPAGAGKTAALATAFDAWSRAGVPVYGAALAAVAARRLEDATGIRSDSLHRLLVDLDRFDPEIRGPTGLAPGTVVVVDEASLAGTRQLARLFEHVARAGGKCVLVGDPAQLAEVEAGGLFAALTRAENPIELSGNQRQQHAWERRALAQLRAGRVDKAVNAYLGHGRIHPTASAQHAAEQTVAGYLEHHRPARDPYSVVMLTATRADAAALNQRARAALREAGHLGVDPLPDLALAVGDLVVVTRNDRRRGLLNGTRAQVTGIDRRGVLLRTEDDRQASVTLDWARTRLQHAYALTCHKAQGLTVDIALLYGSGALCQQAGYVGLSRGRWANHVYASLGGLHPEFEPGESDLPPRYRKLHPRAGEPAEVLAALRDRLLVSRSHTLASLQGPDPYPYQLTHTQDRSHGLSR